MIDFFDSKYLTEPAQANRLFGVCDNGSLAYTITSGEPTKWIAVVTNDRQKTMQFVPIDHNIVVHNKKGEEISQCDGMLYDKDYSWIAFVELKEVRKLKKKKPYEQLESTVKLFLANHDYKLFGNRYAYVANRKQRSPFAYSYKDEMQTFRNRYRFRLLYQRDINVK